MPFVLSCFPRGKGDGVLIALIAVSAAIFAIDKPYSYYAPDQMNLQPGMRVIVPFGRGNRRSEGIVLELKDDVGIGLKAVEEVLDQEPVLTQGFIRMAAFIRERYFCTFYEAIKAMLPAGLWFHTEVRYMLTQEQYDDEKLRRITLGPEIVQCIHEHGGAMSLPELKKAFEDHKALDDSLLSLQKKKYLTSNLDFAKKIKDKTERLIALAVPAEEAMEYANKRIRSAPLQYEFLKLLCTVGSGSEKELCYLTGASRQTVRRLEELGYLSCQERDVLRTSLPNYVEPAPAIILNDEQSAVYDRFLAQYRQKQPGVGLLYGVTGSGKTSIYIRLIQDVLKEGKGAIFLVPEISLTPQLIYLLMSHFGDDVAVLHSALRVSERYDAWKKIKQGEARVVLGTRSAVFAPVENLGLMIVDEEQEHSYKSENAPRYHARQIAIYRGAKEQALVILGSATPSIETMHLAKTGVYTLNRLNMRYNGRDLPEVEIVDMKQELRAGNHSDISVPLREALRRNIQDGRQSILFLNRRGAGQCVICVECGNVQQCPRCSVSLTYHKANGRLMCHHCGYSQHFEEYCPNCAGHHKIIGTGTQKVELQLQQMFPDVNVLRMDADTISSANPHEAVFKRFLDEKVPILIGTQMVTKGLNFDNVTLVGVLDADMSLYINHYRAAETTFSMLTQVIGRSGRGALTGKAIIQTLTPEHTVIRLAAEQNYDEFFDLECTMRQMQNTPPFGDLFTVMFTSIYEEAALAGAYDFRNMLIMRFAGQAINILGPSAAAVTKINHTYRYKLTICCKNNREVRLTLAAALKEFGTNRKHKGVNAFADINSYE